MPGVEPEAIERAAAAAWPAGEVEERGGWLLRHTPGLDRARSNAALPLVAQPDPAVATAWYATRGAPALVQVAPLERRGVLDAALVGAGWEERTRVDVLAARAANVATAVLGALAGWARGAGAGTLYLQVLADNAAAHALYERAGFARSHGYVHRAAPARARVRR
jgi:GNAT superfamily N-acetyltransferase